MFDLITGQTAHAPRHQTAPLLISITVHATIVTAVVLGTVMFIAAPVPQMDMMMAFVAAPPPPPPPPPPAPAPPKPKPDTPVPTSGNVAPVEVPTEIVAEAPAADIVDSGEGGVPGGVPGGVVGGLVPEAPPPPPPPPPVQRGPIRVGGVIKEPALIHRVEPKYPLLALRAQMQGVVILEAIVDEEGRVESVKVLRSPGVFDDAALEAVRQWRYSPVILNGRPEKFILAVVVSFRLL